MWVNLANIGYFLNSSTCFFIGISFFLLFLFENIQIFGKKKYEMKKMISEAGEYLIHKYEVFLLGLDLKI